MSAPMLSVERCAPATRLAPVKGKPCAADAAPLTGAARGGCDEGVGTRGVPLLFDHGSAGSNAGQEAKCLERNLNSHQQAGSMRDGGTKC
jgi:hypothetical protein